MTFIATFRRLASHCRNPLAVRKLRLATGLTIFVYVTLHLVDHALLNISVSAADAMLSLQVWIWQGVLGTIALYVALATHASLGLWALYERRHFGWTMTEVVQLVLGLSIPVLLSARSHRRGRRRSAQAEPGRTGQLVCLALKQFRSS